MHHKTSTTLEEKIRPCASSTAIANSRKKSKKSSLCATSRGHLHLSLHKPISKVLERSEVFHQACHRRHHGRQTVPPPYACNITRNSIDPPRHHTTKTNCRRWGGDTQLHLRTTASQCLLQNDAPYGKNGATRHHHLIRETQI
jgi:hypothetical protein